MRRGHACVWTNEKRTTFKVTCWMMESISEQHKQLNIFIFWSLIADYSGAKDRSAILSLVIRRWTANWMVICWSNGRYYVMWIVRHWKIPHLIVQPVVTQNYKHSFCHKIICWAALLREAELDYSENRVYPGNTESSWIQRIQRSLCLPLVNVHSLFSHK